MLRGIAAAARRACEAEHSTALEMDLVSKRLAEIQGPPRSQTTAESEAWQRRQTLTNDALREAAIAGDRLWAFAKMLAGITSESVESVMIVDESLMHKQNKEWKDARNKLAERASHTHFDIVSALFKAALSEGNIKLGIDQMGGVAGDAPALAMMSTSVRKKAAELSARPNTSGGFFTNAVALEGLLDGGAGDLTLEQLFVELKDIGRRLQETAMSTMSTHTPSETVGLEYLGAPRNSLFVRWRPEARAAMNEAYHLLMREMQVTQQHGRALLPFELIEGACEPLTYQFASLTSLLMSHHKMQNPASAAYVSRQAAIGIQHSIRVALTKLASLVRSYVVQYPSPKHVSRKAYFEARGNVYGSAAPAPYNRVPYRGGWSINLYGSA
jgi:hypothetical protein